MDFHDVNLDGGHPNLDFSFDATYSKMDAGIGGFRAEGKTWDFGSVGNATTGEIKDGKAAEAGKGKDVKDSSTNFGASYPWSSTNKIQNQKKTTMSSDFDFGGFQANQDTIDIDLALNGAADPIPDIWSFSVNNDKKQRGPGAAKEKNEEEDAETVSALPEPAEREVADSSLAWNTSKKDRNKAKKVGEAEKINDPSPDPLEPALEAGDSWPSVKTGKKGKKKGAKGATEDPVSAVKTAAPAAEPQSTSDWALPNHKTDKKNKNKGAFNEAEDDPIVATEDAATGGITGAGEDDWMNAAWTTGSKKKDKKSKKKGPVEEAEGDPIVAIEDAATGGTIAAGEDDWMNPAAWTTGSKKKDKKGTKNAGPESNGTPESTTAADTNINTSNTIGDDDWDFSTAKSKKDNKLKKVDSKASDIPPVPPTPPPLSAPETVQKDNSWGTSTRNNKKGGKKGKAASLEPVIQEPQASATHAEEPKEESTWSSWNVSATDKKKGEKDVKKRDTTELAAEFPAETLAEFTQEAPPVEDAWNALGMAGKKKNGKNGKDEPPPPAPTPPAQGLTPEPSPAAVSKWDDDEWGELTLTTKAKGDTKRGALPRSTTLMSKTSKSDDAKAKSKDVKTDGDDPITASKDEKTQSKIDAAKEETPAKAAKSIWGGLSSFSGTTTPTAKSKLAKEKEKKEEEGKAEKEQEAAALEGVFPEPADDPKSKQLKTTGKTSKAEAKSVGKTGAKKKKADEAALIDTMEEPLPDVEKSSSKVTKSDAKTASDKEAKEAEKKEEKKSDDYFGFWGSSKKTAGKDDGEIDNQGWTNENDALAAFPNELEGPVADEANPPKPSKIMSTSAKKSKITTSSSVAARIKALEANKKEEKAEKLRAGSQLAKDPEQPPKEEKKKDLLPKSKTVSASTSKQTKKKELPPPAEEKKSKDIVPGSFPGAFGGDDDDDLMVLDDFLPAPESTSGKKAKDEKKVPKMVKMEDLLVEAPEPPKLPTPPPEEKKPVKKERARVERTGTGSSWGFWGAAPAPKKDSAKKEISKALNEEDVAPPPQKKSAAPGLSRSKPTKTPQEKKRQDKIDAEKTSKSSDSETKEKRPESRPSKPSRGMSFSSFMMGVHPPSATRTKPARRSSVAGGAKSTSRRPSVDMDAGGLMSPPPEDQPRISDKAAKLIGVKGGKFEGVKSVKGKERASSTLSLPGKERATADEYFQVVPDPYPIDDDDMVMVNGLEDPLLNGVSSKSPPKEKMSKTKSKRQVRITSISNSSSPPKPSGESGFMKGRHADGMVSYKQSKPSKPRARTLSNDDNVVMVEAGPSGVEPFVNSGPDDMAFVEHTAPELKRSNTTTKKSGGFFGGFFGGAGKSERASEPVVRSRPTSSYRDERMIDAEPLPARIKDKSKRQPMKAYQNDIEVLEQIEPDPDAEARRAERRKSRHNQEKAGLEARRSKARDRARKEQEAEEQRREEKRRRRVAREDARLRAEANVEAAAAARRDERRQLRAELEASELEKARIAAQEQDDVEKIRSSIKDDRKKQFEREEEDRLRRREEKKYKPSRDNDKSGSGKRKSTTSPLMDEYFESRNGTSKLPGGPTEKTSSWVKSQASDPPDLPPVEGTILDGEKPRSGADLNEDSEGEREERRHSSRKESSSKRRSKYVRDDADPADSRRSSRRKQSHRNPGPDRDDERAVRSGSGSGGDAGAAYTTKHRSSRRRDPTTLLHGEYDAYAGAGPAAAAIRTFDGKPAPSSNKRNSILGRLGGFL